ncbi:M1 family metallopeptidase [Algibacter mikhailovii]|uniref:Aminopeptidase N n=1 Tax=Algibacter mikhailovii TaxID=425498 RepID=A0A918V3V9_9FLAO|nr:M1 family metallopeptidase [Algibacter mikhailovii]GGZ68537.1 aminopeptidase [Algibacter mikhailovii]
MIKYLFIWCLGAQFLFGQQTEYVDFKSAYADIYFNDVSNHTITGSVIYYFEVLKDIDSVYIDAKGFNSIHYKLDGQHKDSLYTNDKLIVKYPFKANSEHKIAISYQTIPKKTMYFIDWDFEDGNPQIWTQGQGKYTSHWLPSFDDMNEKVEFDLNITFHEDYQVIANGKLTYKQNNESTITWMYDMQKPMSSYLLALAIGKYRKRVAYASSGIPLEMYYYPKDSLKFEPTYRYTKRMFDFLENEIGFAYPWQNYKQIPVKDFLYAGMENTSATIFSDAFVVDSTAFIDKNYVNVNAHELAHQWFGDLVTETSGTHHWLQEGFATYYALLAEREVFGVDYYHYKLFEYAEELKMQDAAGGSTALLDPKSSSTTFYKKGAWALTILHEKVGDKAFKKAIKNYLKNYQFKNVETIDFIDAVEKTSRKDLSDFVATWLESETLHYDQLRDFLSKKSADYKLFFELDCQGAKQACFNFLETSKNNLLKIEVINSLGGAIPEYLYGSKDIKIRQALAQTVYDIPLEQKANYESLLKDKSYTTMETALYNLWRNFPLEREKYLDETKGVIGFNDKNIRILWLTLALITEDYDNVYRRRYLRELTSYTGPKYSFEIRQNAFSYLNQIEACKEACKDNLKLATKHHNWRFKKFAKDLLHTIN